MQINVRDEPFFTRIEKQISNEGKEECYISPLINQPLLLEYVNLFKQIEILSLPNMWGGIF